MPAISGILVRSGQQATIGGESEDLCVYSSPVNSDKISSRIGEEKIVMDQEIIDLAGSRFRVTHTSGQRFKLINGAVQGENSPF